MDKELIIADGGSVLTPVWVPAGSPEAVAYAAREAAGFLSRMSGASIPVLSGESPPLRCVAVGDSPVLEADVSLGEEGFLVRSQGERVLITGGSSRGVLYGVYAFLEALGCRFFSSRVSHIPTRSCLAVPPLSLREVPGLQYREVHFPDAHDANWAVRNRNNGNFTRIDRQRGERVQWRPFDHTFDMLVPVSKWYDSHPEYFSLVNGERLREKTQLCLSHPEVLRLAVEGVRGWLSERPETRIVSVSQNDWYNPCQCETCRRTDLEEDSHAGSLLRFVNAVAEEIEKTHPNVMISTLAYQYTRRPPGLTRPRRNVCVMLCTIECCFAHPLRSCHKVCSFPEKAGEAAFQQDLEGWSRICDRLYIWDYVVNYSHYVMPFPNFYVLADNIRYLMENNVKGIFEEGAPTVGGNTEFAELRAYVVSRLLWNPHQDTDLLVTEFLAGYYRAASPAIGDYFRLIHRKAAEHPDGHFGIYDPPRINYLTPQVTAACRGHLERARALADNDEILRRVRIASMPLRYWELYTMPLGEPDRGKLADAFFEELIELGITEIWEGRSLKESRKQMDRGIVWRFEEGEA